MELDKAKRIAGILDNVSLTEDYSGRGMFGGSTAAIVCESREQVICDIVDCYSADDEEKLQLIKALSQCRQDNMGYDKVYY